MSKKVKFTIETEGADKKTKTLKHLGLATRYQLEKWNAGTVKTIIRNVSGGIIGKHKKGSTKSGELRRSIKYKMGGTKNNVRSEIGSWGVIYARILERGGTIRPKRVQYLTIPLPGVKGWARNYENAFFIKSKKGNLLLVQSKGKGLKPLFVLKKSVQIPAFEWLEKSVDKQRPLLASMLAKQELIKVAERLK